MQIQPLLRFALWGVNTSYHLSGPKKQRCLRSINSCMICTMGQTGPTGFLPAQSMLPREPRPHRPVVLPLPRQVQGPFMYRDSMTAGILEIHHHGNAGRHSRYRINLRCTLNWGIVLHEICFCNLISCMSFSTTLTVEPVQLL